MDGKLIVLCYPVILGELTITTFRYKRPHRGITALTCIICLIISAGVATRVVNSRRLFKLLVLSTELVDRVAVEMCMAEELRWQKTLLGHTFTMSRGSCMVECESSTKAVVTAFRSWLQAHEDAQVMFASVLVVVGVWWLVRTMLALLINLVCPILVVILAVVCVPQLRTPLLGQNYSLLASLLRNILLKLAETLKT